MRRERRGSAGSEAYLVDRCCLTCGYRGRELQGRRGQERLVCPRCRQDLYTRPARSYAEMEGLVEAPGEAGTAARRRMDLLRLAGGLIGAVLVRAEKGGKRRRAAARV